VAKALGLESAILALTPVFNPRTPRELPDVDEERRPKATLSVYVEARRVWVWDDDIDKKWPRLQVYPGWVGLKGAFPSR